ncbi:MAG: hypothetical protein WCF33_24880 [Pseudonocardiaceae bacterium]
MLGVAVADVVPNATELQPLLDESPYGSKIASRRLSGDPQPG